jgi:hypothetical protein
MIVSNILHNLQPQGPWIETVSLTFARQQLFVVFGITPSIKVLI